MACAVVVGEAPPPPGPAEVVPVPSDWTVGLSSLPHAVTATATATARTTIRILIPATVDAPPPALLPPALSRGRAGRDGIAARRLSWHDRGGRKRDHIPTRDGVVGLVAVGIVVRKSGAGRHVDAAL